MPFSKTEAAILLAVKGVGPTIVQRLEEMGYRTLENLAAADRDVILSHGAAMTGSSCWKNSPLARAAVSGAILAAQSEIASKKAE